MPPGRVLRIDPGRRSVQVERRGRVSDALLVEADDLDVDTLPVRTVRAWLADLVAGDLDAVLGRYRPTAVVHVPRGMAQGPAAIESALGDLGWIGGPDRPPLSGDEAVVRTVDRFVLVEAPAGMPHPLAFLVEPGESGESGEADPVGVGWIVEQWIGVDPEAEPGAGAPLEVTRRGAVSDAAVDYALDKVAHLLSGLGQSATWGRIKLSHQANPAHERPSQAEVAVDLDGSVVRVHAGARTMPEAIDEAAERLRASVERLHDRHRHLPEGLPPEPGHWRKGNRPLSHRTGFERPVDEREVVRHKSFAPDRLSLDEALWDLGLLDYDFFLFVEQSTGIDCVVARGDGDEAVVHGLAERPEVEARLARPGVIFSSRPVPVLGTADAIALLDVSGEPFEIYEHPRTGRRNVVYRRYDGHYGLITPPAATHPDTPPSEERLVHEGPRHEAG